MIESPQIDMEFKSLIPPLSEIERQLLEESIVSEGCRDALVTWRGVLLDGHTRLEICQQYGIAFSVAEKDLPDRTAALLWIIDTQRGRRNLADIDLIKLALKKQELLKPPAQENLKGFKGNQYTGPLLKLTKDQKPIDTRKEAAKAAGVSALTYDAGKRILKAVDAGKLEPQIIESLRNREIAIHRVDKDLKEKEQREERKQARVKAVDSLPELDKRILVGDFRQQAQHISDGSLSLIFTDPPYDRQASKMLPELATFAAAKLADGGSLICYVGQTQLPDAIDALRTKLRYWWTIACVYSGRKTIMREYGINAGWKAVLWFVKGTRDNNSIMVNDVMSGGEEKSHHDWQQSESEAAYWIEQLCPPDGIVCDPFLGGGTTGTAAEKLGRRWIGIEIDPEQAKIASGRVTS